MPLASPTDNSITGFATRWLRRGVSALWPSDAASRKPLELLLPLGAHDWCRAPPPRPLNLLILVGASGLAKSRTVRELLGEDACWNEDNAIPFGMYTKLYRDRDKFVVIDDADSLHADRNGAPLLKCLCQTEPEKAVAWHSAARALQREGIPREFTTTSRLVIICNDWKTLNRNVVALQDRGYMLVFEPTAEEVHRKTDEWFDELNIYEWFGNNLPLIRDPSMRHYIRAAGLKRAGMEWMHITPLSSENKRERLVAEILADTSLCTAQSRVQAFSERGGGCKSTYYNYAGRLKRNGLKAAAV